MRRTTFIDHPVTYAAVGGTQAEDLLRYPPKGYRPFERQVRLGNGRSRFESAAASVMTWGVQRRSGVEVTDVRDGLPPAHPQLHSGETVFGQDGTPYLESGMTAVLKVPTRPFAMRESVRVVYVVDEPDRVGFAYGTLPGGPFSGERAFTVEFREDASVWLVIRSFSRPGRGHYRLLAPLVRLLDARLSRRHLRALSSVRTA